MGVLSAGRGRGPRPTPGPRPCATPPRPHPASPLLAFGLGSCRLPAGEGRAMSHGPGLVRTTCSSGSAPGAGAGAGPLGASSSEGLLDPVYPRTHAALLKVAQMVREARARAGVTRGGRGGAAPAAGASRPGRGSRRPSQVGGGFLGRVARAAPALELGTPGRPVRAAPARRSQVFPATLRSLRAGDRNHGQSSCVSAFLFSGSAASDPGRGWRAAGRRRSGRGSRPSPAASFPGPRAAGLPARAHPRPSAGSEGQAFTGVESPGTLGAAVPGPAPQVPRAGRFSGPLDGSGQWGRPFGEPVLIWGERESPEWGSLWSGQDEGLGAECHRRCRDLQQRRPCPACSPVPHSSLPSHVFLPYNLKILNTFPVCSVSFETGLGSL